MNDLLRLWQASASNWRSWEQRDNAVKRYAWAVLTDDALDTLAKLSPIVEMGAGTGYWAHLLRGLGADVVAYDARPPESAWTEVLRGTPRTLVKHPDRTLFLCWPPYDEPMAARCLRFYKGDRLVYVGEGWGGCTADDRFFEMLEDDWEETAHVAIPQWYGIHDGMTVYRRK